MNRPVNCVIERIARAAFPELADCPRLWTLARRCGDVRDELDGIPCSTVTPEQRNRIFTEAKAAGIEITAHEPTSPVFAGAA